MNFLYYDQKLEYPNEKFDYSPSEFYPEYKGKTIASEKNSVYEAIRNIFILNRMDLDHYGAQNWNPLGEFIRPGNTVLIKPNLVLHKNNLAGKEDSLDCMVTHPSIIRCILDYVMIALNGTGRVYIGDSPVKDCDFELLMEKHHYNTIQQYYSDCEIIKWVDMRGPEEERKSSTSLKGVIVNLSKDSYFYSYKNQKGLRIPNYDYRMVVTHHHGETQEYCISELVTQADVIINLPKPKTHRKNGYTGALKNFVGVSYNKEFLPHHTIGDKSKSGDEFYKQTILKKTISNLRSQRDIIRNKSLEHTNDKVFKLLLRLEGYIRRLDNIVTPKGGLETVSEGIWYQNDTLWRTVLDLNNVVHYVDKNGVMRKEKQRIVIHLCDMIISGEKEGPLAPTEKKENVLLFGTNAVELDALLVRLMHFRIDRLRCIKVALEDGLLDCAKYDDIVIYSNDFRYNNKYLKELDLSEFTPFRAASGWAGYIEEI